MSKETMYLVPENILREILRNYHTLNAGDWGGVDNWEWWSESISNYIKDYSEYYDTKFESIEDIVEWDMKGFNKTEEKV